MKKIGSRIMLAAVPLALLNMFVNGVPRSWNALLHGLTWGPGMWSFLLTCTAGLAFAGSWAIVRAFSQPVTVRDVALALIGSVGCMLAMALVWAVIFDWEGPATGIGWALAFARAGDWSLFPSTMRIAACSWAAIAAAVAAMVGGSLVGFATARKARTASTVRTVNTTTVGCTC